MFILRTFDPNGIEYNRTIGNSYKVVSREESYETFSEVYKKLFGKIHVADLDTESDKISKKIFAIILIEDGGRLPLYKDGKYYIMTPGGRTFDNLTYK